MKKIIIAACISLCCSPCFAAVELDADANGATDIGKGGTNATTAAQAAINIGVGTTSNPSFASVHASGGNLAAANKQVTKAWMSSASVAYTADVTSVIHGGHHWICKQSHTSNATGAEPGVGANWTTYWKYSGEVIDASGFDGNLATTDDTLQEIAQKVDDLVLGSGSPEVQDEAFSAANFDADTTHAVSQDDFYDRMHLYDADDDGSFTDEAWFPSTTGAPTSASYLTTTAEAGLSAEANLGALTTGLLKITVAAGSATPSTAVAGTDYQTPLTAGTNYLRPTTDVDDTPVNGETAQPVSSNWAYDHVAATDPHTGYVLESALGTDIGTFLATPTAANFFTAITGEGAFAATLFGYADAPAVLAGIGAQAADADLTDLADGSLTGSKVGTGINGDNVTSGTIADARIASTIARDSELPNLAAPGAIGGTTPAPVTATTLSAGAGGFAVDADGDTTVKSLSPIKSSGVAGDLGLYEANSTDTHAAGRRGPLSLAADAAYRGQYANAGPSEPAIEVWGTATSGDGAAATPWIHPVPFITLGPLFTVSGSSLVFSSSAVPNMGGISFGADPADSGAVRLSNNTAIYWEAATPGTDIPIAVDNFNIIQMGQNAAGINFNSAPVAGFDLGASDTTIARSGAGAVTVEGVQVVLAGGNIGAGTATTPSANDNDTSVATTAYVQAEIAATASDTETLTNKTLDTAGTGNAITVPLNGLLDNTITTPADADDLTYKQMQYAATITDIICWTEGGGTIALTLQECTGGPATTCGNIEGAITCDADGAEDDGTLTDGAIAAGSHIRVLFGAPSSTVDKLTWNVRGTQTW